MHGHYDSWYVGIGDNATGDAALLELARVLWGAARSAEAQRADRLVAGALDRPLRGIDVVRRHLRRRDRRALHRAARHRLARLRRRHGLRRSDVDGGGATRSARSAIHDALGLRVRSGCGRCAPATTRSTRSARPASTCCSRTFPIDERKARGYYAVGGCGGNIAWHTPDDLMPVADLEILRRDLAVYLTTIVRMVNAPLHPFDYAAAVDEIATAVAQYQTGRRRRGRLSADSSRISSALGDEIARVASRGRRADRREPPTTRRAPAAQRACCGGSRGCWCRSTTRAASASITIRPLKFGAVPRLEAAAAPAVGAGRRCKPVHQGRARPRTNKVRAMLRAVRRELSVSPPSRSLG